MAKRYVVTGQFVGKKTPSWKAHAKTQKERVYETIEAAGTAGMTVDGVVAATGFPRNNVAFYVNELKKANAIGEAGTTTYAKTKTKTATPPPPPPPYRCAKCGTSLPPVNGVCPMCVKAQPAAPKPMTPTRDAKLAALVSLEVTFKAVAREVKAAGDDARYAELSATFSKYQKIKARATDPASLATAEADVALRIATLELVKAIY